MTYRAAAPSVSHGPPPMAVEWWVIDREDESNRVVEVAQTAYTAWRKSLIKRDHQLLEFSECDVVLKDGE